MMPARAHSEVQMMIEAELHRMEREFYEAYRTHDELRSVLFLRLEDVSIER